MNRVLGEHGIPKYSAAALEGRWVIGSEEFRKELLEQMQPQTTGRFGAEVRESDKEKANRVVAEELRKLRWDEAELEARRKGDQQKVRMAQRLRKETTMTVEWIAERLRMGTRKHLTHLLYWSMRQE